MLQFLLQPLIVCLSFYVGARLLSGVSTLSLIQSMFLAIIIAVLDITVGSFLKIASLGILSLGIFSWLLNAVLIQLASWLLGGFKVRNFWWALALAAIVSLASSFMKGLLGS